MPKPNQVEIATAAIDMRAGFGQEAEPVPPHLKQIIYQIIQLRIRDLENLVPDLSPAIIALFEAIKGQLKNAPLILAEKLTAQRNLAEFTRGTENGIAQDMPTEMVPLVIATLAKITAISQTAHQQYEQLKNHLPNLLTQLREALVRQALLDRQQKLENLTAQQATLEKAQRDALDATSNLDHNPDQQRQVIAQTAWIKKSIAEIKSKILDRKQQLEMLWSEFGLFQQGASQLRQPVMT